MSFLIFVFYLFYSKTLPFSKGDRVSRTQDSFPIYTSILCVAVLLQIGKEWTGKCLTYILSIGRIEAGGHKMGNFIQANRFPFQFVSFWMVYPSSFSLIDQSIIKLCNLSDICILSRTKAENKLFDSSIIFDVFVRFCLKDYADTQIECGLVFTLSIKLRDIFFFFQL